MGDLHPIVLQLDTYRVSAKFIICLQKSYKINARIVENFPLVETKAKIHPKSANVTYDNNLVQMRY